MPNVAKAPKVASQMRAKGAVSRRSLATGVRLEA